MTEKDDRYLTEQNFDAVTAYIPALEQQQPRDLFRAFGDNGFVSLPFAASRWSEEALRYIRDPQLVRNADLETCVKLITFHQRADHWECGHFDYAVRSGHILAIVCRLAVLRDELHFPVKQPRIEPLPEPEGAFVPSTRRVSHQPLPERSLAVRGQLIALPGLYRVVTVDTFEGSFADHLVGDFGTVKEAEQAAKARVGGMVVAYIYDDKGKLIAELS